MTPISENSFQFWMEKYIVHVPLLAALLRFVVEELSGAGCVLLVVEMVPEEARIIRSRFSLQLVFSQQTGREYWVAGFRHLL